MGDKFCCTNSVRKFCLLVFHRLYGFCVAYFGHFSGSVFHIEMCRFVGWLLQTVCWGNALGLLLS